MIIFLYLLHRLSFFEHLALHLMGCHAGFPCWSLRLFLHLGFCCCLEVFRREWGTQFFANFGTKSYCRTCGCSFLGECNRTTRGGEATAWTEDRKPKKESKRKTQRIFGSSKGKKCVRWRKWWRWRLVSTRWSTRSRTMAGHLRHFRINFLCNDAALLCVVWLLMERLWVRNGWR